MSPDGNSLTGVRWPIDFFHGIRVWAGLQRGGSLVQLATLPLEEPVMAAGSLRFFEFDAALLTPAPSAPGAAGTLPVTLRRLLVRALRRHGRLDGDKRRASVQELAMAALAPGLVESMLPGVRRSLEAAVADGDLEREGEDYIAPAPRVSPSWPQWGEATDRLRAWVRSAHHVSFHLRKLTVSAVALPERQHLYQMKIAELGLQGIYPGELPRGYTFVLEHERGC